MFAADLRPRDVAICAGTSSYVVRMYDDAGLLGPVPRSDANYRYMTVLAVSHVCLWSTVQKSGYTMREIQAFGKNRTPESTQELLQDCDSRLESEIAALRTRQDILRSYIERIGEGRAAQPGRIELRDLPARSVRLISPEQIATAKNGFERTRNIFAHIRKNGNVGCPLGFGYNDFASLTDTPEQPARLISYDPQGPDILPAGRYLVGTVKCRYGEKNDLPQRMLDCAMRLKLDFHGPACMVYLIDAVSITEKEQYLLQIVAGIKGDALGVHTASPPLWSTSGSAQSI